MLSRTQEQEDRKNRILTACKEIDIIPTPLLRKVISETVEEYKHASEAQVVYEMVMSGQEKGFIFSDDEQKAALEKYKRKYPGQLPGRLVDTVSPVVVERSQEVKSPRSATQPVPTTQSAQSVSVTPVVQQAAAVPVPQPRVVVSAPATPISIKRQPIRREAGVLLLAKVRERRVNKIEAKDIAPNLAQVEISIVPSALFSEESVG